MEIILVRHTSVAVPPGTCYGQTDVDVADTFELEASATLRSLAPYVPFDAIYSSPLQRARKLAAFCGYAAPRLDDRLMEMSMGEWEMKPYSELTDDYAKQWFDDYLSMPTPGGEGFPMLRQRVDEFLDELRLKPYQRVAVFAHGGVLVCAGLYGGLFELENAYSHQVGYGGIERIEI
mgnify:CR=1 FL=1